MAGYDSKAALVRVENPVGACCVFSEQFQIHLYKLQESIKISVPDLDSD
jgi:hypothetical protein